MFKLNSFCNECFDPHKIVWSCKKHISEKDWLYLCGNCVRLYKYRYGKYFKSQFQNIKSFRWCTLKLSKLNLPLFNVS